MLSLGLHFLAFKSSSLQATPVYNPNWLYEWSSHYWFNLKLSPTSRLSFSPVLFIHLSKLQQNPCKSAIDSTRNYHHSLKFIFHHLYTYTFIFTYLHKTIHTTSVTHTHRKWFCKNDFSDTFENAHAINKWVFVGKIWDILVLRGNLDHQIPLTLKAIKACKQ